MSVGGGGGEVKEGKGGRGALANETLQRARAEQLSGVWRRLFISTWIQKESGEGREIQTGKISTQCWKTIS